MDSSDYNNKLVMKTKQFYGTFYDARDFADSVSGYISIKFSEGGIRYYEVSWWEDKE